MAQLLEQRAHIGCRPPKAATVNEYGKPIPAARTRAGNTSAFTAALIDVNPVSNTIPAHCTSSSTAKESRRACSSGTLDSAKPSPKKSSRGRRPKRSDRSPPSGWSSPKNASEIVPASNASDVSTPALSTAYVGRYDVHV